MSVLAAVNCNRTYLAQGQSLGADFTSHIADFRDMPMGSLQFIWTGVAGTLDGQIVIFVSNIPDESVFDDLEGAVIPIQSASGARMWIRERIGFRYLLARFTKNGITAGSMDIVALGKKS